MEIDAAVRGLEGVERPSCYHTLLQLNLAGLMDEFSARTANWTSLFEISSFPDKRA